ncbi:MAG: M48 family metalloprotease [Symploca sp. SIO1C2]|nr:M48 family metalloprotease [Symploca sp. SIO1C2]
MMKFFRKLRWMTLGIVFSLILHLLPIFTLTLSAQSQSSSSEGNCIADANLQGLTREQLLEQGDECFLEGNREIAEQFYRRAKPPFKKPKPQDRFPLSKKSSEEFEILDPIFDEEELSIRGRTFWSSYQESKNKPKLASAKFAPLFFLIKSDSNFIPGYFALVNTFKEHPEWCKREANAKMCNNQPHNALEVLEQGTALYPEEPNLVVAKIDELVTEKEFLEASIEARQYYISTGDNEFEEKAEEYLGRYKSDLSSELKAASAICVIASSLLGNLNNCQILGLLLKGESEYGRIVAEQFKEQLPIVEKPEVLAYVEDTASAFLPYMGRNDFEFEFNVVEDNSLNAFALPGGKIFINTGAILGTNSRAELAGLLGHEVAHSIYSHTYRDAAQGAILNSFGDIFLKNLPYDIEILGNNFSDILKLGITMLSKAYNRDQEREADILGTRVLAQSGYAADGLYNFMVTVQNVEEANQPPPQEGASFQDLIQPLLSTHPETQNRVSYLRELIRSNGYNRYVLEGVEKHKEMQNLIQNS